LGSRKLISGLIPGFGGTQRLPHRIGHNKARELIMTGEMFDAKTALDWGLANQVVAPGELMDTARKLAEKLASKSGNRAQAGQGGSQSRVHDERGRRGCASSREAFGGGIRQRGSRRGGRRHLVEKRPPAWQHK